MSPSTHPHLRHIHNCLVHTRHDAVPGSCSNDTGQQGIQLTTVQCLGVDLDILEVFTQNCHPQFAVRQSKVIREVLAGGEDIERSKEEEEEEEKEEEKRRKNRVWKEEW